MKEVISGVFQEKTSIVNWYLIVDEGGLTLIDAGVRSTYQQVMDLVRFLELNIADLTRILLTHADTDHVGAAMALKAESGAKIYASQIASDALAEGHSSRSLQVGILTPFFNWFERQGGGTQVAVDKIVAEGQTIPVLGGLKVIETPGHTPGHLSYYAEEMKLLFAGDAVRTKTGQVGYNWFKATNWAHEIMRQSVHKLAALKPEIVCCGHGPVVFDAASKFPPLT